MFVPRYLLLVFPVNAHCITEAAELPVKPVEMTTDVEVPKFLFTEKTEMSPSIPASFRFPQVSRSEKFR